FASALVRAGFSRVALLMGGIDALRIAEPTTTLSSTNGSMTAVSQAGAAPSSPSLSGTPTTPPVANTTTIVVTPTICSCRVIRQVISVHAKIKDEVVVHKCKTPFAQKKLRSNTLVKNINTMTQDKK
ncbi:hypothetical protein BG011_001059, partial [Mortierella polycephala]